MTPAQYRRWRFYAESLIEQAISILDSAGLGKLTWRMAGMGSHPSRLLPVEKARSSGALARMMTGRFPIMPLHQS
jgi:hypothetical protein